jgi:coproporphyrinogen III oxidase-like Fe-S oxidoreductase
MKKCWDILIKQLFAKSHFFELKWKERSKVNDFMRTIKKILNELVEFENIPSDNMVVEQVINALPRSYGIFVHVISNENDMSTLEDLFK